MSGDYGSPERKGYGSCDIFYSQKQNGKMDNAGKCRSTGKYTQLGKHNPVLVAMVKHFILLEEV